MTARKPRILVLFSLLAAGLLGSSMASAHGGEDHGGETRVALPAGAIAPRASAESEDYELVVVLDESPAKHRRLLITVDRFKTNEPVAGARLEVEAGGQNLPVREQEPGVYELQFAALDSLAPGARLPLTITVEGADSADLLSATLELPATSPDAITGGHGKAGWAAWAAAAGLVVAALAWLIIRRQQKGPQ